jgi:hypothetical protein
MAGIQIPVSFGELVDKITILEIKSERISDPAKLANVQRELTKLGEVLRPLIAATPALQPVKASLRAINEALWQIEDDIRECERKKDFGERFVGLARDVYRTNDKRAATKREIDRLMGSEIVEEKSYAAYD